MIEIRNLTKKYGDLTVYDNFNLSIEEGKILSVFGESGSGKTTLLNCIAHLTPFSGEISVGSCSYVFQSPRLVPNLTVKENLKLICSDEKKVEEMLERVKLLEKADAYPNKLSGGQAQRVSLARAFLFDRDLLLMDEPLTSLDLHTKKEITELFYDIWSAKKCTVVYVTHDVDEAACLAHRIIILDKGEIKYDLTPNNPPLRDLKACSPIREQLISMLL